MLNSYRPCMRLPPVVLPIDRAQVGFTFRLAPVHQVCMDFWWVIGLHHWDPDRPDVLCVAYVHLHSCTSYSGFIPTVHMVLGWMVHEFV